MKTYTTENPPKSGNALKAWNYLTIHNPHFVNRHPKKLYFAKRFDGVYRDVWVGDWGSINGGYDSGIPMTWTVESYLLLLLDKFGKENKELIKEVVAKARDMKSKGLL